jgi:hypothetical protein
MRDTDLRGEAPEMLTCVEFGGWSFDVQWSRPQQCLAEEGRVVWSLHRA